MIDFAKQLELYISSGYYKDQIAIGAFSTRFRKFFLENERAKDTLFMIDVLQGEADEKKKALDLLEEIKNGFEWKLENSPETMDKSDIEKLEEINQLLEENGYITKTAPDGKN